MKARLGRTCLGCRQVRTRAELIRVVRGGDGRARMDVKQREPGRGAYVCPDPSCLRTALTKARLGHAFRGATEPPAESPEAILQMRAQEERVLWRDV